MWNYIKNLFGFGQPVDPCNGSKVCQALAQAKEAYESLPNYSVVGTGVGIAVVGAGYLATRRSGSKEGLTVDVAPSTPEAAKTPGLVATRVAQAQSAIVQSNTVQTSTPKPLTSDADVTRENLERARQNAATSSNGVVLKRK